MLSRVGTPRSPDLRPGEQGAGSGPLSCRIRQGALQADVAGGKCIGLAQFPHRDVLRRPLANAWERTKVRHTFSEAAAGAEYARIRDNRRREGRERRCAHPRHPERAEIRRCQHVGTRKDMRQSFCVQAVWQPKAVLRDQFSCQADRGGHRDLLAEHRANREFESIPRTGDAQPWSRGDQRGEQVIPG
jgi:hypothetical protein